MISVPEKIRAFIAIEIPNISTLEAIEKFQIQLQNCLGPLKFVERPLMHMTLRFLGDITESDAQQIFHFLENEINRKFFGTGPINAQVMGFGDFSKRVFYVDVQQVADLLIQINHQIETKLREFPQIKREEKQFTPHITIARAKDLHSVESRKPQTIAGQKSYAELKQEYLNFDFGLWRLEKVVLKKSVLTPKGPIYTNISY